MHMHELQTQESRDVAIPQVGVAERAFAAAGAVTVALGAIGVAIDLAPQLNLIAITSGVLFGIVNLRWWRIIVRALLSSNQISTGARHFFFVFNLAFKVSLLLLVVYGLSRWEKDVVRSFLMGFIGFLTLGGLLLLIIGLRVSPEVDSETPSK